MTEIILVRHGETEWNASEIFRGRADIALNGNGLKQAQLLSKYLNGEKIDAVYSSPLTRAVKTAEAIAGPRSLEILIAPELLDLNYGFWQGLSASAVKERYPEVYQKWLETPGQVVIPGGECLEDVKKRALPFLQKTAVEYPGKKVAIVSHRVVLKVLICALLEIANDKFVNIKLDTAGITRFTLNGKTAVLNSHNDTSYLHALAGLQLADF